MKIPAFALSTCSLLPHFHPLRTRAVSALLGAFLALTPCASHAIIDLDADTLDDVWEEAFNAQALLPGDDEDGDGSTNYDECVAGTDPFNPESCHDIQGASHDDDTATVTWPSVDGKRYRVQLGTTLGGTGVFQNFGDPLHGTGANLSVLLSATGSGDITGSATHEIWTGITGAQVSALTGDPNYPNNPSGTQALGKLQIASNTDDNYGGRIRGFIKPPADGSYTFYLATRNRGEFWLSTDDTAGNKALVASVSNNLVQPEDWTAFASQSSGGITLAAGQKYYFEVLHKHAGQEDHCAVGWEGPGLSGGIQVVDGEYLCPIVSPSGPAPIGGNRHFFRVVVEDLDQDGDGISDYAEKLMAGEGNFSPFDANSTTSGSDDITTVTNALGAGTETVDVVVADATSYEDPRNDNQVNASTPIANTGRNVARFRIQRTGGLQPLTVSYTLGNVPLPDESASPADYSEEDANGAPLTGTLVLGFGQVSAQVVIHPGEDGVHEYPEKVRCAVVDTAAYDLGASPTGDATIYDCRDIPSQEILFVAYSTPEPGAIAPQGSAVVSGKMKGTKDHMSLNTVISSGFSSAQDDSHVHKSNDTGGPAPGPIVYEITNIPGEPVSDPLLGQIGPDYPYPIEFSGGITARRIVDSFFNQNLESPMYLNWHTVNNGSGELWALFSEASGSIDPPVHPPMPGHTLLTGDDLERDVYRFLNQATFGATDAEVQAIVNAIETERTTGGNPTYSRIEEFENWIDAQTALDQTYLLDYLLAVKNQEWKLRDYHEPASWHKEALFPNDTSLGPNAAGQSYTQLPIPPISPSTDPNAPLAMPVPATWPGVDRSNPDPLQWRFSADYSLSSSRRIWGDDRDNSAAVPRQRYSGGQWRNNQYEHWAIRDFGRPNERSRYLIHWMMHVNAHDQLRQKMGFALQQICVVANTLTIIQDRDLGMANYQDQINRMAFGKYRDIIEWIMWSPQMGHWLSSIKNQKAADISNPPDGVIDVFPDENLAREVMQLFTCGLFMLHPDSSLALDSTNGLARASYDNDDITELSRVITGQSYSLYNNGNNNTRHQRFDAPVNNNNFNRGNGNSRMGHAFNYPMKMFGAFHDTEPKTILGGKVIDNTSLSDDTAIGNADMKDALDWLAGVPGDGQPDFDQVHSHQSTAPFIAKRLIQRFVTSNPTPAYVQRVTEAFRDGYDGNGQGEGDLGSAIKAILLDHEARDPAAATGTFGLKKSPYEAYVHLLRAFDAHSQTPLTPYTGSEPSSYVGNGDYSAANTELFIGNLGYPAGQLDNFRLNTHFRYNTTDTVLSMSPMNQPTVFNFYLTDYSPGGVISAASMVAPEMMLANDTSLYRNINYFYTITVNLNGESELDLIRDEDAFKVTSGNANNNERIRIDLVDFAAANYPPESVGNELARDTAFFDEMDRRLTGGLLKQLYPWNPGDDDDPSRDGVSPASPTYGDGNLTNDDEFMNPREAIIRFMRDYYAPTGNGPRDKLRFGLYLLTTSPDYLVRQ